jgi:hypothetical protein
MTVITRGRRRRPLRLRMCFVPPGHRIGYRLTPRTQRPGPIMEWLEDRFVTTWNRVYCWLHGHDFVLVSIPEPEPEIHCPHCCTVLGIRDRS